MARDYVNGRQTPEERRAKYARVFKVTRKSALARRCRDWTEGHINLLLDALR